MNEIQFRIMNSNVAYKTSLIYFYSLLYSVTEEVIMFVLKGLERNNNSGIEHSCDHF